MPPKRVLFAGLTHFALLAAIGASLQGCTGGKGDGTAAPAMRELQSTSAARVAEQVEVAPGFIVPTTDPGGAPECCAFTYGAAAADPGARGSTGGVCGYMATALSTSCEWVNGQSQGLGGMMVQLDGVGADGLPGTNDDVAITTGTDAQGCFWFSRLDYPASYSVSVTDAASATLTCDTDGGALGEVAFDLTAEVPALGPLAFGSEE